jgi:sugar phosphate isomerase/epimerase
MRLPILAVLALILSVGTTHAAEEGGKSPSSFRIDHPGLKKLSWQLLCQTSTFRELSVMQVMDVLHANDFHHLELSSGQSLMTDHNKDVPIGPEMSPVHLGMLQNKMRETHLDIVSYRVADFGHTEADARKVFEFAQKLTARNIVVGADVRSLDKLDQLANEYQINMAVVNGPADTDKLIHLLKQRSPRVGVCLDITALRSAGGDPLEMVRSLKGRIFEVHLTDTSNAQEAVVVADVLKELAQERFKGAFCVRTDSDKDALQSLTKVVNGFSDIVTKLAATQ